MERHEENIVKLVSGNDLSIISTGRKINNFITFPKLFKKYNAKVYCLHLCEKMTKNMYNYMLCQEGVKNCEIGYDIGSEKFITCDTKIVYATYKVVIDMFMKKKLNFCNIIILDELHHYSIYYEQLLYLWLNFYKDCTIPKLVLTLTTKYIPYIPSLDLSNSIYVIKDNFNPPIEYEVNNSNNKAKEMLKKIFELHNDKKLGCDDMSTWIIYLWDNKSINYISNGLKQIKLDLDFTVWNNKLIYNQKGKRLLILTKENINFNVPHVDGIIDSMYEIYKTSSMIGGNNYIKRNTSKSNAEIRSYLQTDRGFIHRMCTKDEYKNLSNYTQTDLDKLNLTYMFLDLCNCNLDPYKIFETRLNKKVIDKYMYPIKNYDINTNKLFQYNLPLSLYNIIFLSNWIKEQNNDNKIYIGVVFACILDLKHSIFKSPPDKEYYKGMDTLELYSYMFFNWKIRKDSRDKFLSNDINNIDKNEFNRLVKKIDKTYEILKKNININSTIELLIKEIALIYSDRLLNKLVSEFGDTITTENIAILKSKGITHVIKIEDSNKSKEISVVDLVNTNKNELDTKIVQLQIDCDKVKCIVKNVYSDNICSFLSKNKYLNIETQKKYSLCQYKHYSLKKPSEYIVSLDSVAILDSGNEKKSTKAINYYINLR